MGALLKFENKRVVTREAVLRDIEKAKEEEAARVTTVLKAQYEGEMSWLERLLRDNQAQGEKIAFLEAHIIEERSVAEAKLAQGKAFHTKTALTA